MQCDPDRAIRQEIIVFLGQEDLASWELWGMGTDPGVHILFQHDFLPLPFSMRIQTQGEPRPGLACASGQDMSQGQGRDAVDSSCWVQGADERFSSEGGGVSRQGVDRKGQDSCTPLTDAGRRRWPWHRLRN